MRLTLRPYGGKQPNNAVEQVQAQIQNIKEVLNLHLQQMVGTSQ